MCPAYIAGPIGPGDRKSIQPIAARADALSHDWLHHFIGAGLWDSMPLEATLWQALSARDLRWPFGIPRHQRVYPADVRLIFPVAGRGRPRGAACARHQIPSSPCQARRCEMAAGQLAPRDQRLPDGSLCRHACGHHRWRATADRNCWHSIYATRRASVGA